MQKVIPKIIIFTALICSCDTQRKAIDPVEVELAAQGCKFWRWEEPTGGASPRKKLLGVIKMDGDIVIPPHIDVLSLGKGILHGHKQPCDRPAEWMSDDWSKDSWFILKEGKVHWFRNKAACENALNSSGGGRLRAKE